MAHPDRPVPMAGLTWLPDRPLPTLELVPLELPPVPVPVLEPPGQICVEGIRGGGQPVCWAGTFPTTCSRMARFTDQANATATGRAGRYSLRIARLRYSAVGSSKAPGVGGALALTHRQQMIPSPTAHAKNMPMGSGCLGGGRGRGRPATRSRPRRLEQVRQGHVVVADQAVAPDPDRVPGPGDREPDSDHVSSSPSRARGWPGPPAWRGRTGRTAAPRPFRRPPGSAYGSACRHARPAPRTPRPEPRRC